MYWLVIIYFAVITYLLGASAALILKYKGKDLFEDLLMRIAIGLGIFPVLTIILNWIKIIDWKTYFIISIIIPIFWLFKKHETSKDKIKLELRKTHIYYVILILLFATSMFVYAKGAFTYPYLEDGDPLSHAYASKYISETGTYSTPVDKRITHYLEPYPPFYSALMSIFIQFSAYDIIWVLKTINALLISLSVIFIFFLVRKITGSNAKSIMSAALLLAINSYLSHFIFSASYATTMILPAIYFLVKTDKDHKYNKKEETVKNKEKENKSEKEEKNRKTSGKSRKEILDIKSLEWKSIILSAIMISAVFLIQPITAAILALFLFIYFICNLKNNSSAKAVFIAIITGLLLSQIYWIPSISKYGINTTSEVLGFGMFINRPGGTDNDSSGGIIYKFSDFMNAPIANKIDQPTGIGTVLFLIFLLSAAIMIWKIKKITKSESEYSKIALPLLIWTALIVVLIMSNALPFKFVPHRLWAYFSIGVVLITVIGGGILLNSTKNKSIKTIIIILFIVGVTMTSFVPKYKVQTSFWPPGPEYTSMEELQGYMELNNKLQRNTPIFAFCSANEKIASSNMKPIYHNQELDTLKRNLELALNKNYSVSDTLKKAKASYIIVDTECAISLGVNETNNLLNKLREEKFTPAITNNGFFLLKVP